jgi:predicted nucleic-acid-binding Zn-ribbon protein
MLYYNYCSRCNGDMAEDDEGLVCLQCGNHRYFERPVLVTREYAPEDVRATMRSEAWRKKKERG